MTLERYIHVANAWCDSNSACFPRSAVQAQGQAQPRTCSFRVSCAIQAQHPEVDARIAILALTTQQPSLLLRVSGAGLPLLKAESGSRAVLEEGDYIYEWPLFPTGGRRNDRRGDGRPRNVDSANNFGNSGNMRDVMACMALSKDLGRLLCVTREGVAYGLRTRQVIQRARRLSKDAHDNTGNGPGGEVRPETKSKKAWEDSEGGVTRGAAHRLNLLGPSLFDLSLEPKYQKDTFAPFQTQSGGDSSTGNSGGSSSMSAGSGGAGNSERFAKAISLGSTSTEGDFVPQCCIWWTLGRLGGRSVGPVGPASSMALVGGTSGGRGALSIIDMDHGREVDLLYVPSCEVGGADAFGGVSALRIHSLRADGVCSESSSEDVSEQRVLLMTTASGRPFWLVLDCAIDSPAISASHSRNHRGAGLQEDSSGPRSEVAYREPSVGPSGFSPDREVVSRSTPLPGGRPPHPAHRERTKSRGGEGGKDADGEGNGGILATTTSQADGFRGGEAAPLWVWCLSRLDPHLSPERLPRLPRMYSCVNTGNEATEAPCPLWEKDDSRRGGDRSRPGVWEDTSLVSAVESNPRADQGQEQRAFGIIMTRLDAAGRNVTVEVHYCAQAPCGPGAGRPCRRLCEMAVARDLELLETPTESGHGTRGAMCVSRLVEATVMPEKILVLSVGACRLQGGTAGWEAVTDEDEGGESEEEDADSSFWLLIYRLPADEADEKDTDQGVDKGGLRPVTPLSRAFPSPTKAPLRFLDWLVPVKPDIRDVLRLARSRMFLPQNGASPKADSGPDQLLAWSLGVWSQCSIFFLRFVADKKEAMPASPRPAKQGDFVLLQYPKPSSLSSSLQAHALAPGELVKFVEGLGEEGRVDDALVLGWSLLLGAREREGVLLKGPKLHPEYFRRLLGADPELASGRDGRARIALCCVRWMVGTTSAGGWTKEDLLLFLEVCPDYSLKLVVSLLLSRRRVSEALFASWVRGGVPGVSATLDRLGAIAARSPPSPPSPSPASSGSASASSTASLLMPLSRCDVAWLCGVGAGRCIIQAARSVLWAVLPLRLQLDILLSDPQLLLLDEQYQWLLSKLPHLPRPCLGALGLQLSYWVGAGPLPNRDPPPPLPMSPRLMVRVCNRETEGAEVRGVPLFSAWSPRDRVVEGLAMAVDATAQKADVSDPKRKQKEAYSTTDEEVSENLEEVEARKEKQRRNRMLADMFLEVLFILAEPLAFTPIALQARRFAQSSATDNGLPKRPVGLSASVMEGFEAQVLLEKLLARWSCEVTVNGPAAAASPREKRFTPATTLMRALRGEYKNSGAAALLLEAAGDWEDALRLRLEEIIEILVSGGNGDDDELSDQAVEVLLGLLHSHVLRRRGINKLSTRERMAINLLQAWASMELPSNPLEDAILSPAFCNAVSYGNVTSPISTNDCLWVWHMGMALMASLLILHAGTPGSLVDADGGLTVPGSKPLRFSSSFYVRLTEHVIEHGSVMQELGVTDLWSTGGREPTQLRIPMPIPALWDSVCQQISHLERGQAASNRVEVPVESLLAAAYRSPSYEGGDTRDRLDEERGSEYSRAFANGRSSEGVVGRFRVVAFSCGHVLNQAELVQVFVPSLASKLTSLARPLHLTAEILCQEYQAAIRSNKYGPESSVNKQRSDAHISLACPSCVADFLVNMLEQDKNDCKPPLR